MVAFRLEEAEAPAETKEQPTLIGPAAEEAGLTAGPWRRPPATRRAHPERGAPARPPAAVATTPRVPLAVAVGAAIAGGALYGLHQVYFLGTDSGGRAALYRGLPYDLPLGIELYSEVYAAPVQVAAIPASRRGSATDHTLRSHDDAVDLLARPRSWPPSRRFASRRRRGGKQKAGQRGAGKQRSAQNGGSGGGGGQ